MPISAEQKSHIISNKDEFQRIHTLEDLNDYLDRSDLNLTQIVIYEASLEAILSELEASLEDQSRAAIVARHLAQLLETDFDREIFIERLRRIRADEDPDNVFRNNLIRLGDLVNPSGREFRSTLMLANRRVSYSPLADQNICVSSRVLALRLYAQFSEKYGDELPQMIERRRQEEASITPREQEETDNNLDDTFIAYILNNSREVLNSLPTDFSFRFFASRNEGSLIEDFSKSMSSTYTIQAELNQIFVSSLNQLNRDRFDPIFEPPFDLFHLLLGVPFISSIYPSAENINYILTQINAINVDNAINRIKEVYCDLNDDDESLLRVTRQSLIVELTSALESRRQLDLQTIKGQINETQIIREYITYISKGTKSLLQMYKNIYHIPFDRLDTLAIMFAIAICTFKLQQIKEQLFMPQAILEELSASGKPFSERQFDIEMLSRAFFTPEQQAILISSPLRSIASREDILNIFTDTMEAVMTLGDESDEEELQQESRLSS